MEETIQTKHCKQCNAFFEITDEDIEFYKKISPIYGGKKYLIPSPTLCPFCRQQRRLSFRNERKLYKNQCFLTGKNIISVYSPDKKYKIISTKLWLKEYVRNFSTKEFDFSKTFFEQFDELNSITIKPSLFQAGDYENSDYTNFCGYLKDCYLLFDSGKSENCYYSTLCGYGAYLVDTYGAVKSQECYEVIDITNSYKLYFSQSCDNCRESILLKYCNSCSYCIGCINLNNSEYHIFNKMVTKEIFEKTFNEIIKSRQKFEEFRSRYQDFCLKQPVKFYSGTKNENISGDIIFESKNIKNSYGIIGAENCAYCSAIYPEAKDCYDIDSFAENSHLLYEMTSSGGSIQSGEHLSKSAFGVYVYYGGDSNYYNMNCQGGSEKCFGCCDLLSTKYCILNKQYTKEEYENLVPKIIEHMMKTGEWGEFFPSSISPFGYNETLAMEYYPIKKEKTINERFKWSDYEAPFSKVEKIISAGKLPDRIIDIPDDILNRAVECEITKKPFRIIKQELEFYRKHGLPIPKRHPEQRHLDRINQRNPMKLYDGKCYKCGLDIKTTYTPDRNEIVYCEECYEREVY